MKIVLDTNVLVSALLTPHGPCAAILRLVLAGDIVICHDARILCEYENVLHRQKFGFDHDAIAALMDYIDAFGHAVIASPLPYLLPDPDDAPFLEVALSAGANCLVTGNIGHFPEKHRSGMSAVSPAGFMEEWRERLKG